jgi:hypothetical protein
MEQLMTKKNNCMAWIVTVYIICMVLSSCSPNHNDNQMHTLSEKELVSFDEAAMISLDHHTLQNIICMVDDGILVSENTTNSMKYIYIDSSGERNIVGEINNFVISMKQSVLDYPYVYFYVGERINDPQDEMNVLVQLNLQTHEQIEYKYEDDSLLGIPTYVFNDKIVTIKNVVRDNTIETYIESFDVETNTRNIYMKCEYDCNCNEGEAVYGLCSDGGKLYVLHDVCDAIKGVRSYIEVLNYDYEICKSIYISEDIHDYALTSLVSDMQVLGEYVYINNASNNGFLGRINEEVLQEIYRSNDFCISSDASSECPLFYIRRSNTIFLLNDEGELSAVDLEIKNGYCLMAVFSYSDSCFLLLYRDDSPYIGYFMKRDKLMN